MDSTLLHIAKLPVPSAIAAARHAQLCCPCCSATVAAAVHCSRHAPFLIPATLTPLRCYVPDRSKMALNDKLSFEALQLPEGVTLHKVRS